MLPIMRRAIGCRVGLLLLLLFALTIDLLNGDAEEENAVALFANMREARARLFIVGGVSSCVWILSRVVRLA